MSVDAGYIRHFVWAIPWIWGLCAFLWLLWLISHPKIQTGWLAGFHGKVGGWIYPIRIVVCLGVFVLIGLILRTSIHVPQQTQSASTTATQATLPLPEVQQQTPQPTPAPKVKPHKETPPPKPAETPSASASGENSGAVGSINQGNCSVLQVGGSQNQAQGGNCAPADRRLSGDQRTLLVDCMKDNPGKATISSIANNSEVYRYALDWYETFSAAKWDINNGDHIPVEIIMIAGGM